MKCVAEILSGKNPGDVGDCTKKDCPLWKTVRGHQNDCLLRTKLEWQCDALYDLERGMNKVWSVVDRIGRGYTEESTAPRAEALRLLDDYRSIMERTKRWLLEVEKGGKG